MKSVKVLALPSYHPAVSKYNTGEEIVHVNPGCDFFGDGEWKNKENLDRRIPPAEYDLVHINFEYYLEPFSEFKTLLEYFHENGKKIVWTANDKKSLLNAQADYAYEELLFRSADRIITPTPGMKAWIETRFGKSARQIEVIPHGYIASPEIVEQISKRVRKDRHLFSFLVGDFRDSKEYVQSIINFLYCTDLQEARLQLIFRPVYIYESGYSHIREELMYFHQITQHQRISIFCKPEISDEEMASLFYRSHAIIMPYKWGDHSGQIELARDCGCIPVAPNIGFYSEQWDKTIFYKVDDDNFSAVPARYVKALIQADRSEPLLPAGLERKKEFRQAVEATLRVYTEVLNG